jgi:hypothetical protein
MGQDVTARDSKSPIGNCLSANRPMVLFILNASVRHSHIIWLRVLARILLDHPLAALLSVVLMRTGDGRR